VIHSEESSISLHARLGPNHGYSIEGDIALLHAEVAVPNDLQAARTQWALQLWACDAPHAGGPLSGVKVAEAALPVSPAHDPLWLDTEALARVPGGLRDYSMVLVLASGEPGSVDQVHDFANYPQRQRFITPHLEGSVGYRIEDEALVLTAERVRNPRSDGNLSGSLELSLWAQTGDYAGGALEGTLVASADLGCIEGQSALEALEYRLPFNAPPAGRWQMVLALREWAGPAGYVTRDYCTFAMPYEARASEPTPAVHTSEPVPAARASEPTPTVRASEPTPAVRAPEPTPAVRAPEPTPAVRASEPTPVVRPSEPTPVVRASEPTPAVRASEPTPAVRASEPTPAVRASEPTPAAEPEQRAALDSARSVEPAAVSRELRARTPAPAAKELRAPALQPSVTLGDDRISVCGASVDELSAVKGMNRKLAQGIVKSRPFHSVDELIKVRGIGPKLLASLKPFLKL
jgi:Helix-hairpin-helix motif